MNLFASHRNPRLAAEALDDLRVTKMTLETAQMICTVLHHHGERDLPYKPTHQNHPVTKWVIESDSNLYWLLMHHKALAREFNMRTGNTHKSWQDVGKRYHDIIPKQPAPKTFQNSAARSSLGLDFTWVEDVQRAYRMYLRARWRLSKPLWTDRGPPTWLDDSPSIPGNDSFILLKNAKDKISKMKAQSGTMPCPRCIDDLEWTKKNDLITLQCKTPECLYAMEIK